MSDPSITDFNSRIARIENDRAKGHGFEAEGAIGRSFYTRSDPRYRRRFRLPVFRPLVFSLVFGTVMKAVLLHQLGTAAYDARVAGLLAGDRIDRIGGWLMQADPATTALARQIGNFARVDS
ncbi:MAG: hypothetical protein ACK4VZ_01240 [Paracoccaceae bacterium]